MPKYPELAPSLAGIRGSAFSHLAHRLAAHDGEVYPLHVGDTWLEPADGCRMEDLCVEDHPGMHRYAPPQGLPELLDALGRRLTARMGVDTGRSDLLVAAGATGALGAAVGAICEPGDEVMLLAPYWPLIDGIVRAFRAVPVAVPVLGDVRDVDGLLDAVGAACSGRCVALYLSTPNNPTGRCLPAVWIEALVEFARDQGLWLLADEVYEDYAYDGGHTYTRALAPERTFSAHSFSKAFGMAGNRCGYMAGPADRMPDLLKVSTHAWYSTPTASQLAALRILDGRGDAWIDDVRPRYRELGAYAAERLGVDPPEGSTFLFPDVAERLDGNGLEGFLERCVDRGLFLAPGPSFGPYPTHVRVCFTAAAPEVVRRGIDVLAELMGR